MNLDYAGSNPVMPPRLFMDKITLTPANSNVVIRMDSIKASIVAINPEKPKYYPSGIVVGVGKGLFVPTQGFIGSSFKVGDHVAFDPAAARPMPLSPEPEEFYVLVSEDAIFGKLNGAHKESVWFKHGFEA